MARPQNTQQRRQQIADGLIRVMSRRGYEGATVAEIAEAARLSSGLVHYHFSSKQEILLFAVDTLMQRYQDRLSAALREAQAHPAREVSAWLDFHLGLGAHADPDALSCWVMIGAEALRSPEVRHAYENALLGLVRQLTDIIARGVERWFFGCPSPEEAASGLVALVHGYFSVAAAARQAIPPGSAARSALAMANGLLRPVQSLSLEGLAPAA